MWYWMSSSVESSGSVSSSRFTSSFAVLIRVFSHTKCPRNSCRLAPFVLPHVAIFVLLAAAAGAGVVAADARLAVADWLDFLFALRALDRGLLLFGNFARGL